MLASLLPGLREVRTPLTVGYLWLLWGWLMFGEKLPRSRPADGGLVAHVFDLGGILGRPAAVAALSFAAYIIGALGTIPVENNRFSRLLSLGHTGELQRTRREYEEKLKGLGIEPEPGLADLRARLMVANQAMYGEYDRLTAEASFRINMYIPFNFLTTPVWQVSAFGAALLMVASFVLVIQGIYRLRSSRIVLWRGVIADVVDMRPPQVIPSEPS